MKYEKTQIQKNSNVSELNSDSGILASQRVLTAIHRQHDTINKGRLIAR